MANVGCCCSAKPRAELSKDSNGLPYQRQEPEMSSKQAAIPADQSSERSPAEDSDPEYASPVMAGGTRGIEVSKSKSGSMPGRYSGGRERETFPNNQRPPYHMGPSEASSPSDPKEASKRWTFGNLFRRKEKGIPGEKIKSPTVPITIQFEPSRRAKVAGDSSEDIDSSDMEPRYQGFISRKLSGRKPKKVKGLLKVPGSSNPELTTNGRIQSWESTKKMPPMVLNGTQNYSSSGSLSRSLEGSSPLSRGSRAAARDAMKARAEARRRSYLLESSSDEDPDKQSFQGSHSSISSRNRYEAQVNLPQRQTPVASMSSPSLVAPTQQNPTRSPRWEARVVYTQETHGTPEPFVVKLPKNQPWTTNNSIHATESIAPDTQVITAGLRVPFMVRSPTEEPVYANLQAPATPPPPPRRDFARPTSSPNPQFYRPVSCSYLDSYRDPTEVYNSRNMQVQSQDSRNNNGWHTPTRQNQLSEVEQRRYYSPPVETVKVQPVIQNGSPSPQWSQPAVVTSKLGFPVRKLNINEENSGINLPVASSPVHVRASEFWRRKEEESDRSPSRVKSPPYTRPEIHLTADQRRALSRMRSADSSPLPLTKGPGNPLGHLRSNESISSLSSFSAETPSPHFFAKRSSPRIHPGPLHTRNIKSPDFKISTTPTSNGVKEEPKSACERLNVRFSATPSPAPGPSPAVSVSKNQSGKNPSRNLEDALNELEVMYKSLRLSDEDLLDRAERRDLPTAHQELRDKEPVTLSHPFHFSPVPGSMESVFTDSTVDSSRRPRARAPPLRRSSRPDLVQDDMAVRKYESKVVPKPNDPREVVSQTGSYLMLSPAFSPPVSPEPTAYNHNYNDPDVTMDDVTVRNYKRANSIRLIEEPQPLFGIPLGPVTQAAESDYLHSRPVEKYRPLFRHVKNPDVVKDDVAFRNLRKDLSQENNLSKDWTPRLFSPMGSGSGSSENIFNYNIQPEAGSKKLRAIRSLSANISHLVSPHVASSPVNEEVGKWNSLAELNMTQNRSRSMTPARASSYMEPSWVEQAQLDEFGRLGSSESPPLPAVRKSKPNNQLQKKFQFHKPSLPSSPATPVDPNKPRRPWTDILLESFEKQKLREEQLAEAEAEAITDDEVFEDASAVTPRVSPMVTTYTTKASMKLANVQDQNQPLSSQERRGSYAAPVSANEAKKTIYSEPMINGQQRRESYAEPISNGQTRRGSYGEHNASSQARRGSYGEPVNGAPYQISSQERRMSDATARDTRRSSWSDQPKQFETLTSAYEAIAAPTNKKLQFTPLPPPRRLKSIIFSTTDPPQLVHELLTPKSEPEVEQSTIDEQIPESYDQPEQREPEMTLLATPAQEEHEVSPTPSRGEQELDDLIDALVREADNCGPSQSPKTTVADAEVSTPRRRKSRPSRPSSAEKESKWQAAIAEMESLSQAPAFSSAPKAAPDLTPDPVEEMEERPVEYEWVRTVVSPPETTAPEISMAAPSEDTTTADAAPDPDEDLDFKPKAKARSSVIEKQSTGSASSSSPDVEPVRGRGAEPRGKVEENLPMRAERFKPVLGSGASAFTPIKIKTSGELKTGFGVGGSSRRSIPLAASASESAISMSQKTLRSPLQKPTDRWDNEKQIRNAAQIQSPLGMKEMESASSQSDMTTNKDSRSIKNSNASPETADGMIGLRRLLRKENTPIPTPVVPKSEDKFGVKKSSSAIIGNSYWSRISANQPSFLRKFFEKKSPSTPVVAPATEKKTEVESDVEPFVALNVAEKASHFMKLEHEQRFSKWRNNGTKKEDRSKSNRYSTQPVTPLEVQTAVKTRTDTPNVNTSESRPEIGDVPVMASDVQPGTKSSSAEFDDASALSPLEPSSLSLKDRVHMFNRLSRISINSPPQTPLTSTSRRESRVGNPDIVFRRPPSKSEIESSYEDLTLVLPLDQKPGLGSSLGKSTSSPIPFLRNARVQSMYAQAMDSKSEDETSSGGQEVAEIISRSYENSPIVRKKSWRSLKSTPASSTQGIKLKKLDDNISNWSTATDFSMRMDKKNGHTSFSKVTLPVVRSLPTTTSNLLPILTALSSSDDQLSESKPPKVTSHSFRKVPRPVSSEVRVPYPDDESFRTFFKNDLSTFPAQESPKVSHKDSNEDLNLGWVERDGELLVNLKRELPRRKSSGKSRNPLKVLAARIDFKNQKYTETLQ